jgi:hypothetical protein
MKKIKRKWEVITIVDNYGNKEIQISRNRGAAGYDLIHIPEKDISDFSEAVNAGVNEYLESLTWTWLKIPCCHNL